MVTYICNRKYFKCPGFYCVPYRYTCDGKWDCPGGLEEMMNCHREACPGLFKCRSSSICVTTQSICDGICDCQFREDEFFCNISISNCPVQCRCLLFSILCHKAVMSSFARINIYQFVFISFHQSDPSNILTLLKKSFQMVLFGSAV